jgi:hypothetical protein
VLTPSAIKENFFCRLAEILCDGKHPGGSWVTPIGGGPALRLLSWIFCGFPCQVSMLPDISKVGYISFEVAGGEISRSIGGLKKILGMGAFQRHIAFKQSLTISSRKPSYWP